LKIIKVILISFFISIIFYFSWLENPNFNKVEIIPSWLNNWSNLHGQLRTCLPFIPLGYILNTYRNKYLFSIRGLFVCFLVICFAEVGQFFIPTRFPDFIDFIFGLLGSFIGIFIHGLINKFETKI
jgi:glycopeptide antibiotics resistance protein